MFVSLASLVLFVSAEADAPKFTVEQLAARSKAAITVVTIKGREGTQHGLGTGFVISEDGLVVTNMHVIGQGRDIQVELADGRKTPVVAVHAHDRGLDLAVLKIDPAGKKLAKLDLGDSAATPVGAPLVVIGNPHGLKHSVVAGVNSGVREIDGRPMLQLAVPIEPGNSGGPVLDAQGRVVGVVTMKSAVNDNLGFAVAIESLRPLLDKPNSIPMARWLTLGALDAREWTPLFGAQWQQRGGRILVSGTGQGFGGRSLCLWHGATPEGPFEVGVRVRLNDEAGAAGLVVHSDGANQHYGFYPSNGKLRLSRFSGPDVFQWQVLRELPSPHYRPGEWNHLKVRVEKERLVCYVNDEPVIDEKDAAFSKGRVGLAKFRQTEAEFAGFALAQALPTSRVPPESTAKLRTLVDALPPLATLRAEQLAPLGTTAAASVAVLNDQAKALEQRAEELRRIAADVRTQESIRRLLAVIGDKDDFDLLRAALEIARLDEEEIDVDDYVRQVDRMVREIREKLPEKADAAARLAALDKYLFAENGFHGSRFDYDHRANSYLNRVIDDREGLPITLSVLYLELARRLDLNVVGVGLPGHFVVKHIAPDGAEQLIDVFEDARRMTRDDAAKLVRDRADQPLTDDLLRAATRREIVTRMLRNLLGLAQRKPDRAAMLRYLETLLAVDPRLAQERGLRAIVRYETGRRDAAVADLDWFLEHEPDGIDLERIRAMRELFLQQRPR